MPGTLKILSSMAPRGVIAGAIALYRAHCPNRIEAQAAGGVDVARRVSSGEAIDIVVLASDAIDKLITGGTLVEAGRVDLMTSGIAAAVRAGTLHPDIANEAALKKAVLDAASVSYSTGPSGTYLETLFDRWGILAIIRDRIVIPSPGVPVAHLVAAGDVVLGFQQLSELMNAQGVDVLGALPAPIQHTTTFTAGISRTCEDFAAANDFLSFMASPQADALKQRHGMAPARASGTA